MRRLPRRGRHRALRGRLRPGYSRLIIRARFFYALRPDAVAAAELAALAIEVADRWGGRPFAASDIHLTLAFVGIRPVDEQARFEAILDALRLHGETDADAIDLTRCAPTTLSQLGRFKHGVRWIGPGKDESTAPIDCVAHQLRQRLRAASIAFDERASALHATLARGAQGFDDTRVRPIIVRGWTLALGASSLASRVSALPSGLHTPQPDASSPRYRWWPSARNDQPPSRVY